MGVDTADCHSHRGCDGDLLQCFLHLPPMRGVLSIEGANTFAWIEGRPLLSCLAGREGIGLHQQQGDVLVFKVGEYYPELRDGRFALRCPITEWPNFRWAEESVDEAEIRLSVSHAGERVAFPIPTADLAHNPEGYTHFRQWALKRSREWASKPTEANALASLVAAAESMGWAVAQYSPPNTDLFPASPKSQRDTNRNYVLKLRKPGQEHITMAPNFPHFIRSLTALIESLPELDMETQDAH